MQTHELIQGSPEWLAYRAHHFNASDAPAMMGVSPYKTRTQLLHEMHTGLVPEVDPATQRRFDDGHRFEALARPLACDIIGEDLYPVTGSDGKLSASFDGLTMLGDVAFEHKTLNDDLRAAFDQIDSIAPEHRDTAGGAELPLIYRIQMEQQCAVSGCEKVLFMASRWAADGTLLEARHCWYFPDLAMRAKILAGWDQFAADLAAYVPSVVEVKPVGRTPDNLPALRIEVTGAVTASNLAEYKAHALEVFKGINRELTTDQDFATAESTVKWCSEVESKLAAAKEHALSQTASIDELFKAIDDISAEARRTRLELDKLVKARKEQIRETIVADGRKALVEHVASLNERLGKAYMPPVSADFAGAIKGKRTIDSLRDAVSTTLANAKIEASAIADRIQINLGTLRDLAKDHAFLFADTASIVLKAPDDLTALVKSRIADHMAAEAKRLEAERERIRAEEQARIEREQREAAATEKQAPMLDRGSEQSKREVILINGADLAPSPRIRQATQEAATVKLGEICALVGPGFSMTAAFVADTLGIEHSATDKAAKLYKPSDVALICDELIQRLSKISAGQLKAA